MGFITDNDDWHKLMIEWRRGLHQQPETAFQEVNTSNRIAQVLADAGIEIHRGLGTTGIVATLKGPNPEFGTLALRADMDALDLQELNTFPHTSKINGKMHACGHDGHTSMLLGAACWLAKNPDIVKGTLHFIFQPAEENEGGAREMVKEGLFEQFPIDAIFGMHNWPALNQGRGAVHDGAVMAAYDTFEICVQGKGCHAAMPNQGIDPLVITAEIILALQTIVSRKVDPNKSAVVSVTQIHSGDAWNIIPDEALVRGSCRYFDEDIQALIQNQIRQISEGIANSHGASAKVTYMPRYPATINSKAEARLAAEVLQGLLGTTNVDRNLPPSMGAEDFSFFLQQRPGAYIWMGNGSANHLATLHNPHYDFNDGILPLGANYWIKLTDAWFTSRSV